MTIWVAGTLVVIYSEIRGNGAVSTRCKLSHATKGDIRQVEKSTTWHFRLPYKLTRIDTKDDKKLLN